MKEEDFFSNLGMGISYTAPKRAALKAAPQESLEKEYTAPSTTFSSTFNMDQADLGEVGGGWGGDDDDLELDFGRKGARKGKKEKTPLVVMDSDGEDIDLAL